VNAHEVRLRQALSHSALAFGSVENQSPEDTRASHKGITNTESRERRVVVGAVGVRRETVDPGAVLALAPERRPHRADEPTRRVFMDTRDPRTDEAQERARFVRVLGELVPAAFAVDDVRREVVHESVALVLFVEHDERATDIDTAGESRGDVGEAVDAHFFLVLL